jgi:4-carboxymuconolactone decarboxylase
MPQRLDPFVPDDLGPEQRRLYDTIVTGPRAASSSGTPMVDAAGRLRGPFNAMLLSPAVGDALQSVGAAIRYRTALTDRAREIATLLVAHHCASDYEWDAHRVLALRAGLTEAEIASLRTPAPQVADEVEGVVATCTLSLLHTGDLPDDLYADAERVLGTTVLFELVTLVGYYRLLAGVLAVFRVPGTAAHPPERDPDPA